MSLTDLGVMPVMVADPQLLRHVVHLPNGLWALVIGNEYDPNETSVQIYKWGEWDFTLGTAIWQQDGVQGGQLTPQGVYRYRAPLLGPGYPSIVYTQNPWEPTLLADIPPGVTQLDWPLASPWAPFNAMPLEVDEFALRYLSDGRTWHEIGTAIQFQFVADWNGQGPSAVPERGCLVVNGRVFPVPGWAATAASIGGGSSMTRWTYGVIPEGLPGAGTTGWYADSYEKGAGIWHVRNAVVASTVGSGYALGVAMNFPDELGAYTSFGIVELATGQTRALTLPREVIVAGPVIRQGKAIYYSIPSSQLQSTFRADRRVLDLHTLTVKTERQEPVQLLNQPNGWPPYLTDVPRVGATSDGRLQLFMDDDAVEVTGLEGLSLSRNIFLMSPGVIAGRAQRTGVTMKAIRWNGDTSLDGGGHRSKGFFA